MVHSQTFSWNILVLEEGGSGGVESPKQETTDICCSRNTEFHSRSRSPYGQFKLSWQLMAAGSIRVSTDVRFHGLKASKKIVVLIWTIGCCSTRIYACGQVGADSLGRSRKQTLWKLLLVEWWSLYKLSQVLYSRQKCIVEKWFIF